MINLFAQRTMLFLVFFSFLFFHLYSVRKIPEESKLKDSPALCINRLREHYSGEKNARAFQPLRAKTSHG
jgi:hypothetical protein